MGFLLRFFAGILMLALTFAAIWASASVFDAVGGLSIKPYFFQPNNLSSRRIGAPQTPAELGMDEMRRRLVTKYITEYFYVIPDAADVTARMRGDSILARLSTPTVFKEWKEGEAEEIQRLANDKALRTVAVVGDIFKPTPDSDYWTVRYQLKTWLAPNDFSQNLQVTDGVLYIVIREEEGLRPSLDIRRYLEQGYDPAGIFKFEVTAIGVPDGGM